MRAIRDNEEAANAMGKNVVKQHLLIFILGSAIVGIAGAMLVTQDGLFTPGSYRPMRYTFLIWVMVIVGGSLELGSAAAFGNFFIWPALLAQKDLRLFAAFDPGLTLPVTAVFSLLPGFSLLYRATPAFVIPAPDFVDLKYFLVFGGCLSLFRITSYPYV